MTGPQDKLFLCPILIGRDSAQMALDALLHSARAGKGEAALITGEAGIGKSRLVRELRTRALSQGVQVLQGNCFEQDRGFPYAPLVDLLRGYIGPQVPGAAASRLGSSARELARLLPELALDPAVPDTDPEREKRRLFNATLQFLADLSAKQALLVLVEDLHWADDTSLELLLHLARRLAAQRILLVMTYRDNEAPPSLGHLLAALDRERLATELRLQALSRSEVAQAVRYIFNLTQPARPDFLDAIYQLTEGNPFFLEEVLKALVLHGDILYANGELSVKPLSDLQVPRSVNDAVQQRAAKLTGSARELLALASVAGQRFDFATLQRVTDRPERELLQDIKELVAAQLIAEESAERFAFRHALTRQAVYSGLLARERRQMHRLLAQAIEGAGGAPDGRIEDLAYHWFQAEEWRQALDCSRRAGEKAQRLYSPRAVVEHLSRALGCARILAQPPPLALLRLRGLAHDTLGAFDYALADEEAALAAAQTSGDRQAEWQLLIDLGSLWSSRDYSRTGDYFQRALALARALGDKGCQARSLNRLGNWHANVGHPDESRQSHVEALGLFQALDDSRGIADTLDLLGMASIMAGDNAQASAYYRQAIATFRAQNNKEGLASSLTTLALRSGNYQNDTVVPVDSETGCLRDNEEGLRLAREIGWRSGESYALWEKALVLGALGDYAVGLETAQQALSLAEEIEHSQWMSAAHFTLGSLYLDLFALPEAQRHLQRALDLAREVNSQLWIGCSASALATLFGLLGKSAEGAALLASVISPDTPLDTIGHRATWCSAGELALHQGDPQRAFDIADRLSATRTGGSSGGVIPRLWKLRGEALTALGRAAEAPEPLLAALQSAQAVEQRRLLWRIHLALGNSYRVQRRRDDADLAFATARSAIQELASQAPAGPLREHFLEQALGALPRASAHSLLREAKAEAGGLTAREREVAALVAQGKSNRAIGDDLVVTERTVETHVANIMSKLGLGSRSQIAAWVASRGLTKQQ